MVRGLLFLLAAAGCGDDGAPPPADGGPDAARDAGVPGPTVILRDRYGVPHVFAPTLGDAIRAFGYADAEDAGEPILVDLYATTLSATRAFGTFCGEPCLGQDQIAASFELPAALADGYPRLAQRTRDVLEAYAAGVNAYFTGRGSPVYDTGGQVTGEMVAGVHMIGRILHAISSTQAALSPAPGGSNQLAVTGARTRGDLTMHLKDPHNTWTASESYVHLSFEGRDLFGNGGYGIVACGGNESVSFGCTRSAPATAITVRARIERVGPGPADPACGPYTAFRYFDHAAGGFVPFEMRCRAIDTGDTGLDGNTWLYESRFGPMTAVGEDADGDGAPDEAYLLQVFAARDVSIMDYFVDRMLVESAADALALYAAPTPREDAQYRAFAGAEGAIAFVLGAAVPDLHPDVDWTVPVGSDDPRIDSWTPHGDWSVIDGVAWYNVDGAGPELPSVLDPAGDFVQNCNGNPSWATEPVGQVGPVPSVVEGRATPTVRDLRLRELVMEATDLDVGALQAIATDIEVVPARALVPALRCGLTASGIDDPAAAFGDGGVLMQLLLDWEAAGFRAEPESQATTVMYLLDGVYDRDYPEDGACFTGSEVNRAGAFLRDVVAPYMRRVYAGAHADPLRVPWGYVNHAEVAGVERGLPGISGRLATLYASFFAFDADTGRAMPGTHGGSRLTQVTAYGGGAVEVFITVPNGQISASRAPGSPHLGQTIDDFVGRRFRRLPLARAEVEADLCPWGDDEGHEHRARTELP